jgi:hypothetical protein
MIVRPAAAFAELPQIFAIVMMMVVMTGMVVRRGQCD